MVRWLERIPVIYKRSMVLMAWIAAGITLVLMFLVAYDVIMRYGTGKASSWITDVSFGFFMVLLTFLPAAWILLIRGHVSVRLLVDHFKPKWQHFMNRLTDILALAYSVILTWQGWTLMWDNVATGYTFPTVSALPRWPVYAIVVTGGLFLCIGFTMRLVGEFWFPKQDLGRPVVGHLEELP